MTTIFQGTAIKEWVSQSVCFQLEKSHSTEMVNHPWLVEQIMWLHEQGQTNVLLSGCLSFHPHGSAMAVFWSSRQASFFISSLSHCWSAGTSAIMEHIWCQPQESCKMNFCCSDIKTCQKMYHPCSILYILFSCLIYSTSLLIGRDTWSIDVRDCHNSTHGWSWSLPMGFFIRQTHTQILMGFSQWVTHTHGSPTHE